MDRQPNMGRRTARKDTALERKIRRIPGIALNKKYTPV